MILYYISLMHKNPDDYMDVHGPLSKEQVRDFPLNDIDQPGFFVRWEEVQDRKTDEPRKVQFSGRMYFYKPLGLDATLSVALARWEEEHPGSKPTIIVHKSILDQATQEETHSGLTVSIVAGTCQPEHFLIGRYE